MGVGRFLEVALRGSGSLSVPRQEAMAGVTLGPHSHAAFGGWMSSWPADTSLGTPSSADAKR